GALDVRAVQGRPDRRTAESPGEDHAVLHAGVHDAAVPPVCLRVEPLLCREQHLQHPAAVHDRAAPPAGAGEEDVGRGTREGGRVLSDPIVALATPPGRSAIALIRLSGRGAFDVAARVLHPFRPAPPRAVRRVRVMHPATGEPVDDALVACFPAPRSYTGDDLVELSTHGGLLVPAAAVAALLAAGARPAAPGEFSRRAVLNGKLDLLQAEATADLIDAGSPAQGRRALQQLDRGLSQRLEQLRAELIELEALIAYEIDFPEEDEGPVAPERVERAWGAARERIARLGIEVSRKYLAAADVVLFCEDERETGKGKRERDARDAFLVQVGAPVVFVRTKADLDTPSDRPTVRQSLAVSVATGEGLADLKRKLAEVAYGRLLALGDVEPVVTRARHREALEHAFAEVNAFREARESGVDAAAAATHLRAALGALDDLIGVVTPDAVLDRVFATFCVGK